MVLKSPAGSELHRDTVRFTVVWFDLDVNNDGSLDGAVDGADNYLPGYESNQPKVSTGSSFKVPGYTGQQMQIIVDGIGAGQGIDEVRIFIDAVTQHDGFAENATHANVTGATKNDDYSFSQSTNNLEANEVMWAGKTTAEFWAKDYGGLATVKLELKQGGAVVFSTTKQIPLDGDGDGVADLWEKQEVQVWNAEYNASETVDNTFFKEDDDKEPTDPDGSGGPLPAHKTAGDSLEVFQEYRGFILDRDPGGHFWLSPAWKELLVEVDVMANVANMPTLVEIKAIMATVAVGFDDENDGAGIDVYWVIDETAAAHEVFATRNAAVTWAAGPSSNAQLTEFVHLMFVDDKNFGNPTSGIASPDWGSYIFIKTAKAWATQYGYINFLPSLSHFAAHELTHNLMRTNSANGYDANEHIADADGTDAANGPNDKKYLMYTATVSENANVIIFSNATRQQIDLTQKESVEL